MIHGPDNTSNLKLLYNLVKKRLPWPLGAFENKRSYCNIENLLFIVEKIKANPHIPSGIYNIPDSESFSTNELQLLAL